MSVDDNINCLQCGQRNDLIQVLHGLSAYLTITDFMQKFIVYFVECLTEVQTDFVTFG